MFVVLKNVNFRYADSNYVASVKFGPSEFFIEGYKSTSSGKQLEKVIFYKRNHLNFNFYPPWREPLSFSVVLTIQQRGKKRNQLSANLEKGTLVSRIRLMDLMQFDIEKKLR